MVDEQRDIILQVEILSVFLKLIMLIIHSNIHSSLEMDKMDIISSWDRKPLET